MKRWHFIAAGLFALAVAGGLWLAAPSEPSKIPLPDGGEIRVLKVSLGTNHVLSFEPLWKQCLRRILPEALQKPLGPFQGEQTRTRWETLVVWLEGPQLSDRSPFSVSRPEAVFANGPAEPGKVQSKQGLVRLSFPCFQRESPRVPLRVMHETNSVLFHVNNPRPAKAVSCSARPLPQTQTVNRAALVLRTLHQDRSGRNGVVEYRPALHLRAITSVAYSVLYWWRVTAFDPWGNYKEGGYNGLAGPRFAPLPPGPGPWRIRMEGEEYLSARMIPFPSNELAFVLSPTPRMQELGIRFLMWVGPGVHTIANGGVRGPVRSSYEAGDSGISSFQGNNDANWSLQFTARAPGLLCVSEMLPDVPRPRMRIHERDEKGEGRINVGKALFSATNSVGNITRLAQFFEAKVPAVFSNRWEVEMISDIAAEFVVEAPAESPTKDHARAAEPRTN